MKGQNVTLRPLGDRVLLRRVMAKEKTDSGIYIPEASKEKPQEALVVAVGDGGDDKPAVAVGDHVLVEKWTGTEVVLAGVEYLVVKQEEIIGVLSAPLLPLGTSEDQVPS